MRKLSVLLLSCLSAFAQFDVSTNGINYIPGAIADGTLHLLSERYSTLTAAQAIYPFATSLTQSIDWAAIQLALNTSKGRPVYLCAANNRIFVINTTIIMGVYGNPPINFVEGGYDGTTLIGGGRYNKACEIRTATNIDAILLNGRSQTLSKVRIEGNNIGHIGIVAFQFYGANIDDNMIHDFTLDGISVDDGYNITSTFNNWPNFNLPPPVDASSFTNSDSTWSRDEVFGNGRDGIHYAFTNPNFAPFYVDSIAWRDMAVFNNQRYGILVRGQNTRIEEGRYYGNCAYGIAVGEDADTGNASPPVHLWFGTIINSPWLEANGTKTSIVCPTKPQTCSACGIYLSLSGVGNLITYGQTFLQTETYAQFAATAKINAPPSFTGGLQITDSARKGIWVRADIGTGSPAISAFVGNGCLSSDTCATPPDADLLLMPFGNTTSKVKLRTNGTDRVIADNLGAWIPSLRVGPTDPGIQASLSINGDQYLKTLNNSHFSGINLVNDTDPNKYLKIARLLPSGGFDGSYGLNAAVFQAGDEGDARPIYLNFQGGDVSLGNATYGVFSTRLVNNGTTITSSMNTSQTSINVASTANFPSYPFQAAIDIEPVIITGSSGATVFLTRCPGCSSPHSGGASLFIYIPAISSHSSVASNSVDLIVQPQGNASKLHFRTSGFDRQIIDSSGNVEILGNLKIDGSCTGCGSGSLSATAPIVYSSSVISCSLCARTDIGQTFAGTQQFNTLRVLSNINLTNATVTAPTGALGLNGSFFVRNANNTGVCSITIAGGLITGLSGC